MTDELTTIDTTAEFLHVHSGQMRTFMDEAELISLVWSIYHRGLTPDQPIIAAPRDNGTSYDCISGHRRFLAYLLAARLRDSLAGGETDYEDIHGLVEHYNERPGGLIAAYEPLKEMYAALPLRLVLFEGNERDQQLAIISHNFGSEHPDLLGQARAFARALKLGSTVKTISHNASVTPAYVRSLVAITELPESIQTLIGERRVAVGAGKAITQLRADKQAGVCKMIEYQGSITLEVIQRVCKNLKDWDGFPLPLEAPSPKMYHLPRLLNEIWQEAVVADSSQAWAIAANIARWHGWKTSLYETDWIEGLLTEDYITQDIYRRKSPNFKLLLPEYLPHITCQECPLGKLPKYQLHEDLPPAQFPCRAKKEGPCINAPMDGAPFIVEAPHSWQSLPGLIDQTSHRVVISSPELMVQAWNEQHGREDGEREQDLGVYDAVATGKRPIDKFRAEIRHFMQNHTELWTEHPLATPCGDCVHIREDSPTNDPDLPFCEWAARMRKAEFYVRNPEGFGKPIPVCRQYQPIPDATWEALLPSTPAPDLPRKWMLEQIRRMTFQLNQQHHQHSASGRRTMLESFTGRPMVKTVDHSGWFVEQLEAHEEALTTEQLWTLTLFVTSDWQAMTRSPTGEHYERTSRYLLLVDGQPLWHKDVPWFDWWKAFKKQEKEDAE